MAESTPRSPCRRGDMRPMTETYVSLGMGQYGRGDGKGERRRTEPSGGLAQLLRVGEGLELLQGPVLDLTDTLAGDVEGATHLLQRARPTADDAVAHFDHLALAARQGGEHPRDVLPAQRLRCDLK